MTPNSEKSRQDLATSKPKTKEELLRQILLSERERNPIKLAHIYSTTLHYKTNTATTTSSGITLNLQRSNCHGCTWPSYKDDPDRVRPPADW